MAKILDQVERLSQAAAHIKGVEPISVPTGVDENGQELSTEDMFKQVNKALADIALAIEHIASAPSANLKKGDELEPLIPISDTTYGEGLEVVDTATGRVVRLEQPEEGTGDPDGDEEEGGDFPTGVNAGDMPIWAIGSDGNGYWDITATEVKQVVNDVIYDIPGAAFLQDVQDYRVIVDGDLIEGETIVELVDCSDGIDGGTYP